MVLNTHVGRQVMDVVIHHPGCDLEEVLKECPDLTWNQVFITVDRLSRQGYVSLRVGKRGHYSIRPVQFAMRSS